MPIYEYRCNSCENEFEKLVRSRTAPAPACPACGSDDVKRKVSLTSFALKGGGWYADGYSSTKGSAGSSSSSSSTGSSSSSSSSSGGSSSSSSSSSSSGSGSSGGSGSDS